MPAENQNGEEKTEEPTAKRISKARSEGTVAKSTDLSQVIGITAAFLGLQFVGPFIWQDLKIIVEGSFTSRYSTEQLTPEVLRFEFYRLLQLVLPDILLLLLIAALAGAGTTALQTKFLLSLKLLRPKFSQLNPINGLKRLLSANNLVNLIKSIAKLCVIGPMAYFAFMALLPKLVGLMDVPIIDLLPFTAYAANYVFWRIIGLLLILAILDWCWQYYRYRRQVKMTKTEVKDERKATEGDMQTKRQMFMKGMQRIREKMMFNVPTADVVVTNPTHLAVALRYEIGQAGAPKVIAKGRGFLAERIKAVAREHGVPVIERKLLARALYKSVEVGQEIPFELYKAVAELLAYVFKIKGKTKMFQRSSAGGA